MYSTRKEGKKAIPIKERLAPADKEVANGKRE